jgi:2-methylisocitrate lyase-like PEP mutase family enzyme
VPKPLVLASASDVASAQIITSSGAADLPVSADIESGYSNTPQAYRTVVKLCSTLGALA